MKSQRVSFEVRFHRRSRHWVQVHLHLNRAVMRMVLTKLKTDHSFHDTNACCWQANKPGKDQLIAELHFCRDHLRLSTIAHECCHAAYHRTVLIGVPFEDESFQEYVAEDTGTLTDAVVAFLDKENIPVRYQLVPGRRLI